jgi:AAHS family 4-hydroxybenzoate transporter-like MFS transporter
MASKTMKIEEIFDGVNFTGYQKLVCTLCFLVTFLDGFDLTVIGVALPKVAEFLHCKMSSLGIALSAGQFGPLVGALVLGSLADRFGRKWVLFVSAIIFGIFTMLVATITNVQELALYRFIAGLGLGGAVPSALTFGSEWAPTRSRSGIVATMYAGMPFGAMTGGLAAAWLIPHLGWQSLFVFGGGIPILIALSLAFALPESLEFLVREPKNEEKVRNIIARVAPSIAYDKSIEFISSVKRTAGVPVKRLFTEGRAVTTILIWIICAAALYLLWILVSWAPTLLKKSGATVIQYSLGYAALNLGAVISSIIIGRLMDKFNAFLVLQIGAICAFFALIAFGSIAGSGAILTIVLMSVVCGLFVNGTQTGTLAVATLAYPPDIRGSGIGWAYAIAKIGAMGAPVVGGYLLAANWSVRDICASQAVLGIFLCIIVTVLKKHLASRAKQTAAMAAEAAPSRA